MGGVCEPRIIQVDKAAQIAALETRLRTLCAEREKIINDRDAAHIG
jgi:hypothetical protein